MIPNVSLLAGPGIKALDVEIVERKGLGHPDSICDSLAEAFSLSLSRFYLDRFGLILHHNVDKALLWGGRSVPSFGGGRVEKPFELYVAGRATTAFNGVKVPVQDLLTEASRDWLRTHIPDLDAEADAVFHALVRPGSADLADLFRRQQDAQMRLANDTAVGVGYAPLSDLETLVYQVERHLTSPAVKAAHPEIGADIKVMGIRRAGDIQLTIGCAFVDRYVADLADYREKKQGVAELAREVAQRLSRHTVSVVVNAADDIAAGSVFLTVTGTSAEAGDDGEAGRGNRANGLNTPYRPMTIEAIAGKNPVTHSGKLYNLLAGLIAAALVDEIPEVQEAQCYLASQIGRRLDDPQVTDIRLRLTDPALLPRIRTIAEEIAATQLGRLDRLWADLLDGTLGFNRWPLDAPATTGKPPP